LARIAIFAVFTAASTALGGLANWAEGLGFGAGNTVTWALGLFTGLCLGSFAERHWPGRPFKHPTRDR
jgi:hypothetical protein